MRCLQGAERGVTRLAQTTLNHTLFLSYAILNEERRGRLEDAGVIPFGVRYAARAGDAILAGDLNWLQGAIR